MAIFDVIKETYPLVADSLKSVKTFAVQEFLDYYGLSSEVLEDAKGNQQEAFGIAPDPSGNYDLNMVANEVSDYLPKLPSGSPMYTTRVTTGSKFKLISFFNQIIEQVKVFNNSKQVSYLADHQINYDEITADLIKQSVIKFVVIKQADKYLLISYFNYGPFLTDTDIEDLIQVVVDGDLQQFKKVFDSWQVYKINHDIAFYNRLLNSQKESKSNNNFINQSLIYTPSEIVKLKRRIDHIEYLSSVVSGNQLVGYHFAF